MNIARKHLGPIALLVFAFVIVAFIAVGCKKKSEPAETSMEDAAETAAAAAEDVKEAAMETTAKIEQTTCPVMEGNPIDKNVFVEYKGKKVYFCCPSCKAKFEKAPEKYIAKLPQFEK